ncbi:hypothetical protein COY96_00570 [Candidatus Wolfebacteria bacterium CG_4_10_14_0_8_um_filter_37_11]|uniref:Type II toxin-antitoxin system antitoxin, RelB/DinJ family n=1 Tax=Candidatus Wolfebacteria bacterium CG_4_10_14_0_8_um_filter_37_11 TaxID=1975062 RepID=A0A2M7Q8B2_9BACT|nr:MAG: hypothetical protein COY96_00570 [Candidatus Wolfebacteria bacterium CG_4_10_14_0_8_um_filter_37_11]
MNTVISVKVDKKVKESAREVAESAGLTLSSLINVYLRQISATRHIEIYAPEQMTPKLEKLISGIEKEIKKGKISKKFTTANDFLVDLKS